MSKGTNLKILFLAMFLTSWMSGVHTGSWSGPAELHAAPLPDDGVIVYQFHRRFRCEACHTLEAAINETIKTHFSKELETGRLVFKVVDMDAEGNDHFAEDYDFFYNTVIVVDRENGKDARFKNLEEVWELVENKDTVVEFMRSHITEYQ